MATIPIPRPLEREVLVEAGHRCAIPACRQTRVEIAHIVPYRENKEHRFDDNLIPLCPTCHSRYDEEEIDRKAMRQFKWKLADLNGRYVELEQWRAAAVGTLSQDRGSPQRMVV